MKKIFVYTLLFSLSLTQGASAAAEDENDLLNAFENAETLLNIQLYYDEESDTTFAMNHDETLTAQVLDSIANYKLHGPQTFHKLWTIRTLINNIESGQSLPFTYQISFEGLEPGWRTYIPFWIPDTPYLLWIASIYSTGRPAKLLVTIIDTSEFTVLYPKTRTQHHGLSLGKFENLEAFFSSFDFFEHTRYDRDRNELLIKTSKDSVTSIPLAVKRKRSVICRNPYFPQPFTPFA